MTTVSKAQICNLGLAHLNQTGTQISNLDTDTGTTAIQCRIHYDIARRFVLADHNWNFATKRLALTDIGSPAQPLTGPIVLNNKRHRNIAAS